MNTNKPIGDISAIGERLAWVCFKYFDGNYSKMARHTESTEPTVRNYIKKGRVPRADFLARLVLQTGVDAGWLLTGQVLSTKENLPELKEVLKYTQAIESIVNSLSKD